MSQSISQTLIFPPITPITAPMSSAWTTLKSQPTSVFSLPAQHPWSQIAWLHSPSVPPGNPESDTYNDHLPDEFALIVYGVGRMSGSPQTLNDGHTSRLITVTLSDFIHNDTKASTVQYMPDVSLTYRQLAEHKLQNPRRNVAASESLISTSLAQEDSAFNRSASNPPPERSTPTFTVYSTCQTNFLFLFIGNDAIHSSNTFNHTGTHGGNHGGNFHSFGLISVQDCGTNWPRSETLFDEELIASQLALSNLRAWPGLEARAWAQPEAAWAWEIPSPSPRARLETPSPGSSPGLGTG
ncbi:hypothetical protein DFH08DRAFT_824134 [Mycena albidolilacea]|uniref:Uncharacterized protein n=1 Tax=Mycena albidolilacea TaxID=1033008 RepID=A0AAD6Z5Y9_9AGAR|nr:hypothetical protein DFH08DRAFT_824134 [Mycena albidolilacea]